MTTITQFNKTLSEFVTKLINIFPVTKVEIMQYYNGLLNGNNMTSDSYCNDFINNTYKYTVDIANKNANIFTQVPYFMPGINFSKFWNSDFNTDNTKKSIWIYLSVFHKLASQYITEKESISSMTPEQLMNYNLQEASKEKISAREQLIQNLTDRELRKELERRKAIKYNTEQAEIDEENLLNFDPHEEFSYWGMFKQFCGNSKVGRDVSGLITKGLEMFDLNPDFNHNDIDYSNLSGTFSKLFTPENIEKIKNKLTELLTTVQTDIDSGKIDIGQFKDLLNNMRTTMESENTSEGFNLSNLINSDTVKTAVSMAETYMGKTLTPEQRKQFGNIMQDPTQILNMFSRGQINKAMNDNRGNAARDRLKKKLNDKQKN